MEKGKFVKKDEDDSVSQYFFPPFDGGRISFYWC
jgi:hypothetical protein